ncbi:MAG: alpha-L-fucosidase [Armatimonadetes bacterium]|nr:alpha-L-fucosidase [Armatimonadota bacterium]
MKTVLFLVVAAALLSAGAFAETVSMPTDLMSRTQWWREARFGMFIHWGIYSVPADSTNLKGEKVAGEWYLNNKQMQVADYARFAPEFNPVSFNARKWVRAARDAGMKYIVITSKHHDGFCMFDSALTDYSITKATPFKKDPMKELAAECKKQGIRLCFYYSIMDWHHPDYLPRRAWETDVRPADGASLDRYIEYMKGQLSELLTNYGPVGILWFDGGWEHSAEELHSAEVNALIRRLQPQIIINDRNRLPEDYSTPEQSIPEDALPDGRLWETCMTINGTWGYAKNDTDWKSSTDLIRKLCDIASKGGNFLLNVGPTSEGVFPDAIDERLADIGRWMKTNGKSIYGTEKSPLKGLPAYARCTQKGRNLYIQMFEWPDGPGLPLAGLKTPPEEVVVLGSDQRLSCMKLDLPEAEYYVVGKILKPDPAATVLELRFKSPPALD